MCYKNVKTMAFYTVRYLKNKNIFNVGYVGIASGIKFVYKHGK